MQADPARGGGRASRPTIRTVAHRAGVSAATVSYVLSGRAGVAGDGVAPATAARVRAAATELGYVANASARAIRTGRTGTVLLCLTMLSDPWSLSAVQAVSAACRGTSLVPLVAADADWRALLRTQPLDVAFIDGISLPGDADVLRTQAARGVRIVVFDEALEADGLDVIRSVAYPGVIELTDHLLERYGDAALLSPTGRVDIPGSRGGAFAEAFAKAGRAPRPQWCLPAGPDDLAAFAAAHHLLTLPERPPAILGTTEFIAHAALRAARILGLRPGVDVGIASVGNAVQSETELTSVGPEGLFSDLADLLVGRALGTRTEEPRVHEFPWRLFVRSSTGGATRP